MRLSRYLLFAALFSLLMSCSSNKRTMEYFKDIDAMGQISLGDYQVKIEPSDEIFISVNSENPEASYAYNLPAVNPALRNSISSSTNPQNQTYTVDPQGDIIFPVLGKIHVEGMTVDQLRDYITAKVSEEVENPSVYVQLVRFVVNVTGEVKIPGRQFVYSPRYTILEALAAAGDLNQYGRRDNVLLIREEDGELKHVRLDLNSADILASPYYYLKQNDYIYVEPNDIRKDNSEYNQYDAYKLSVLSTIVSASASIISLIIALTR